MDLPNELNTFQYTYSSMDDFFYITNTIRKKSCFFKQVYRYDCGKHGKGIKGRQLCDFPKNHGVGLLLL